MIDFFLTPYESVDECTQFEVVPILEYAQRLEIQSESRLSDHSVLLAHVNLPTFWEGDKVQNHYNKVSPQTDYNEDSYQKPTRFKVDEVPHMFMQTRLAECEHLIDSLHETRTSQEEIDDLYEQFSLLPEQMSVYFRKLEDTPQTKKNVSKNLGKPWWSSSLSVLNRRVHRLEKGWRDRKKHGRECRREQALFRSVHDFDREARRLKRKWKRDQVLEMEKLNCEDPVGFWEAVKKLGRKPKKTIPQEVYMPDGTISSDFGRGDGESGEGISDAT